MRAVHSSGRVGSLSKADAWLPAWPPLYKLVLRADIKLLVLLINSSKTHGYPVGLQQRIDKIDKNRLLK